MCVWVCACVCVCACVHAWLEFTDFLLVFGYVDISKITQFTKSPTETSVGESVQSMVMLSPVYTVEPLQFWTPMGLKYVISSEVSSFQRLKCMQECNILEVGKVSCLERCPQFRRVSF